MKAHLVYEYDEFTNSSRSIKAFFSWEKAKKLEEELYENLPPFSHKRYGIEEVEIEE